MPIPSMIAIYFLFYFLSLFVVLPFGVRTPQDEGVELVPGQVESAPANFRFGRTALVTGVVALVPMALFILNYHYGWLTRASFDGLMTYLGAPSLKD